MQKVGIISVLFSWFFGLSQVAHSQISYKKSYKQTSVFLQGGFFVNGDDYIGTSFSFSDTGNLSIGTTNFEHSSNFITFSYNGNLGYGFPSQTSDFIVKSVIPYDNQLTANSKGGKAFGGSFGSKASTVALIDGAGALLDLDEAVHPNGIGDLRTPLLLGQDENSYFFRTTDTLGIQAGTCTIPNPTNTILSLLEYDTSLAIGCARKICDVGSKGCGMTAMKIGNSGRMTFLGHYNTDAIIFGESMDADSTNGFRSVYIIQLDSAWNVLWKAELDQVERVLGLEVDGRNRVFLTVHSGGVWNSDASKFTVNGTTYSETYGVEDTEARLIAMRFSDSGSLDWISINEARDAHSLSGSANWSYDKQFTSYMVSQDVANVIDDSTRGDVVLWAIDSSGTRTNVEYWDLTTSSPDLDISLVGMDSSVMAITISEHEIDLPGSTNIPGSDSGRATVGLFEWQAFEKAKPYSVKEVDSPNQLSVFPNPGSTGFQLSAVPDSDVRLYNNQGRLMATWKPSQDKTYPTEDLPSGIYFIQTTMGERPVSIKWVCF